MRYVCVHGHFYQPPRENPSLEAIELQDSAYPYHDWNERITAECYAPNATSRILDSENRIATLVNNYERISFNFGPTLLSWLAEKAPGTYKAIQQADKASQELFSGHGSAIAQAYNHMILPLANARDKLTQVKWGLSDFRFRFARAPEAMWLPETAVDISTLELLAEQGLKYVILAPRQAKRVRRMTGRSWKDVTGGRIDPSRAYQIRLPSRKSISAFFYDGPISQGVAFERLLDDGKRFAERLISGFSASRTWPQLVHIATDGESYGHHHRHGEMALSYALNHIESSEAAEITNYGEFLERHPPDHLVEIIENSSWSCVHGVERWRSDCGCNSGGHAGWNQQWRGPLRNALDWLRDHLAGLFEEQARGLLKDPWRARNDYIGVILNRSTENVQAFFAEQAARELSEEETVTALKLLEIQRHALLMYTSCGWFFDELSGLETVQVLHYAGRAVQLAKGFGGENIEAKFVDCLRLAKSNMQEYGDGAQIYERWVKPACVDMENFAAHYAISSLFENYGPQASIYCCEVARNDFTVDVEGKLRLATGSARFNSQITRESACLDFAVLHLGDHNIIGGVRRSNCAGTPDKSLRATLSDAFSRADTAEVIRLIDEQFGRKTFSLRSLFRDEQRKILEIILNDNLSATEAAERNLYENQAPLIRFLNSMSVPVPPALKSAAEIAINSQLRRAFNRADLDTNLIESYIREAKASEIPLDSTTLEFALRRRLETDAVAFASEPHNPDRLHALRTALDFAATMPFPVVLWEIQNQCYWPIRELQSELRSSGNGSENNTDAQLLARRDDVLAVSNRLSFQVS
jgi:alpha-amylase/alpha-mannosidase (GH57 family)